MEGMMKKLLLGVMAAFLIQSTAFAAHSTCTSNRHRCDGHCSASAGPKASWCHSDCKSRWGECMQNGTWRYSDAIAHTGVIRGVEKR
jgi:hypothetical protein